MDASGDRSGRAERDEKPVLPDTTDDERESGWGDEVYGERGSGRRDEDWYRRERPPHHE